MANYEQLSPITAEEAAQYKTIAMCTCYREDAWQKSQELMKTVCEAGCRITDANPLYGNFIYLIPHGVENSLKDIVELDEETYLKEKAFSAQ